MNTSVHVRSAARHVRTAALALALTLAGAVAIVDSSPIGADDEVALSEVTPSRIDGENRYDTARLLASLHGSELYAFLALGENFPDALAVSYAVGARGRNEGPILLTRSHNLPDETVAALAELDVRSILVIGGPTAIHQDVVDDLERLGLRVTRVAGADRYETAAAIALGWGVGDPSFVGTLDGQRTALLTSGENFPDALAAGPIAAGAQFPLLLTPTDSSHPAVGATLSELAIERIVIVGGEEAVSAEVMKFYEEAYDVERWAGANRRATAIAVADNAIERLGFDASLTLLARGDNFPDALAASYPASREMAPILLTQAPDALGTETRQWLEERCPDIEVLRALGGTMAVSTGVLNEGVIAAESCGPNP